MNRTQDEIVARIEERKADDFLGFEITEYISFLDYEHAKPYLKDDVTSDDWDGPETDPRHIMIDYMEFAWEKANNFRGISASRSLAHYVAWLWLDGDEEIWPMLDDYEYYGKDHLRRICEYLGLDPDEYDDDVRLNKEPW